MTNMSYCRFRNTRRDLKDCLDNLWDDNLSKEEHNARRSIVCMCKAVADTCYDEDGEADADEIFNDYEEETE